MEFLIIENNTERAKIYDQLGVDRIFIDLELIGKKERQGHLDTVISDHHSISDIAKVKEVVTTSKVLVRSNPIHENSKQEINEIVTAGADIVMLPFFTKPSEVKQFIEYVDGRSKTCLLLETPQALCRIDEILEIKGIDEIHIGLNDLHLEMKLDFMFELLSGGLVEFVANKIKKKGIPFGIGGISSMETGFVPGKLVLAEHVRLGSSKVILSRAFVKSINENFDVLAEELSKIREKENLYKKMSLAELEEFQTVFQSKVSQVRDIIIEKKEKKKIS